MVLTCIVYLAFLHGGTFCKLVLLQQFGICIRTYFMPNDYQ